MRIERTHLPGIGVRYILITDRGEHLGVICRAAGERDLVIYRADDSERAERSIALTGDEAQHLAELLHPTVTVDEHRPESGGGMGVAVLRVAAGSPYDGRPIGDARAGSRGQVDVLAVIHDRHVITAPDPSYVLEHGDSVVVAGHPDDIAALADTLGAEGSAA